MTVHTYRPSLVTKQENERKLSFSGINPVKPSNRTSLLQLRVYQRPYYYSQHQSTIKGRRWLSELSVIVTFIPEKILSFSVLSYLRKHLLRKPLFLTPMSLSDLTTRLRRLNLEEEGIIARLIEISEQRDSIVTELSVLGNTTDQASRASTPTSQERPTVTATSVDSDITFPQSLHNPGDIHSEPYTGRVRGRQTVVPLNSRTYRGIIGETVNDFKRGDHVRILSTTKGYKGFAATVTHTETRWVWIRFKHPRTDQTIECYRAPKSLLITGKHN